MKKYLIILIIILFAGCNEIINITGILINRAANNENISKDIFISVLNANSVKVSSFKVSILEDKDSVLIFNPLYTSSGKTLEFVLPDGQINHLKSETQNLIVIAEHPYIGTFQQLIPAAKLYSDELLIIEFSIGEVPDTLSAAPPHLYRQFKN